jgi:transcription elongation GreA/GreB family factor
MANLAQDIMWIRSREVPAAPEHHAMSRAFVKESEHAAPPPERMVPDGPNPVTEAGLAQIEAEVARLEAALKEGPDVLARETLERDLRYWAVRKASAELAPRPQAGVAGFGSKVTIVRNGRRQTLRIVGTDEADPAKGLVSFQAPLAKAILGAAVGDVVEMANPKGEVEVVAIER